MTLAQKIMNSTETLPSKDMANAIRALAMDAVEAAKSGHPGMPMGMADVATILFRNHLKFDVTNPTWADRDRFILSAGHGSMLIYALGYLCGYSKMTLDQIKNFRQLHFLTAGHPEVMPEVGIEMTTGPLGQGISTAVGFALAERILNAKCGDELVNHKTYVIASDGDLQEGISHEACALAGHLKLKNLIVLWDDNGISIDGSTELSFTEDVLKRYEAYGWDTARIDGHDFAAIDAAITKAKGNTRPTIIACKTTIGYGAPTKAGSASSHGSPLGAEEIKGAKEFYGWTHGAFEIPQNLLNEWREVGTAHKATRETWETTLKNSSKRDEFLFMQNPELGAALDKAITDANNYFLEQKPKMATRATSGKVLEFLIPALPQLIGGSADLTGSNLTKIKGPAIIQAANDYNGQYIHYGVREHGMAAIMNGMALHGGVVPYGGTFMQFTDYCRPSIRLAALMKTRSIFVMTHDSIGLGEDGPTHQPVEHLAAMRAIPNLLTLRPCDGVETAECWQIALQNQTRPSVLVLSRQNLPTIRKDVDKNYSSYGAYILHAASNLPKVILYATGSEVEIAMNAQKMLEDKGVPTQLVSVPSFELFAAQSDEYKKLILGAEGVIRVGVEAGIRMGWDRIIGTDGIFIGMNSFGESAPAEQLYKHFGITAEAIVEAVSVKL